MKTKILPPHAPTLIESTRAIGYSLEAAVADIIDNSIAAKASQIDIDFFPFGEPYISILDDGIGMTKSELITAMQYGSRNPLEERATDDLGRYGLGMKTASLSQCRILTVLTKKNGVFAGAQWNLNYIQKTQNWSLLIFSNEDIQNQNFPSLSKINNYDNGTLVIWQDLDKFAIGENSTEEAFSRKMTLTREHLSLVFHRYLSGEPDLKKLSIKMNNEPVSPQDPFLFKKSFQLMDEETITVRGQKVKITPYILPHISNLSSEELKDLGGKDGLRKNQGFYVYRNKRLLIWGTWFRLMRHGELSKLARVKVDIPNSLDDLWTLDIKKSTATPPEEVRKNLAVIIEKISEGSRRTWTHRGKKEINDTVVHIWNRMISRNGGIYYEINAKHPMIEAIVANHPEMRKQIETMLQQISLSIPLNALYVDLTNDVKITNDTEQTSLDIISVIKSIGSNIPPELKKDWLASLMTTEPFCKYIDEIESAQKRGLFND